MIRLTPRPTLFPYTTLFRSRPGRSSPKYARQTFVKMRARHQGPAGFPSLQLGSSHSVIAEAVAKRFGCPIDRKSTRLNSSHLGISYAVFCLKKKKKEQTKSL